MTYTTESEESTPTTDAVPSEAVTVDANAVSARIRSHVIAAMGLGLVPIPVFDMVSIVAVQLKMVHGLSQLYGIKYSENIAKTLVLSLIGGVLPAAFGATLASFVKIIPGLGSVAGAAGVSVLAGALTYAVGKVFAAHFASGGTLMDFNPKNVRKSFREQFRKGKDVAAQVAEENKQPADSAQ
ncbi:MULTISPECIES: YcjF family protein [Thiorhodovibrio]|uniref:YcjF family protein n=1 Tax=Thiorhodovibrio TaxID=61593 RepID=UPI001911680B|nr:MULTISPECIES: DUF697 domain-containing protein [Thiorhodovibrio]WPL11258.1 GTPase [Thiorhodovibrio litoralis]